MIHLENLLRNAILVFREDTLYGIPFFTGINSLLGLCGLSVKNS